LHLTKQVSAVEKELLELSSSVAGMPVWAWIGVAFGALTAVIGKLWLMHASHHGGNVARISKLEKTLEEKDSKFVEIFGQLNRLEGIAVGHEAAVKETAKAVAERITSKMPEVIDTSIARHFDRN